MWGYFNWFIAFKRIKVLHIISKEPLIANSNRWFLVVWFFQQSLSRSKLMGIVFYQKRIPPVFSILKKGLSFFEPTLVKLRKKESCKNFESIYSCEVHAFDWTYLLVPAAPFEMRSPRAGTRTGHARSITAKALFARLIGELMNLVFSLSLALSFLASCRDCP